MLITLPVPWLSPGNCIWLLNKSVKKYTEPAKKLNSIPLLAFSHQWSAGIKRYRLFPGKHQTLNVEPGTRSGSLLHLLLQLFDGHIIHDAVPVVHALRQVHMGYIILHDLDLITGGHDQQLQMQLFT